MCIKGELLMHYKSHNFSFILVALELQKNMMPQMDDWAHFFKHLPPPENNNLHTHPGTVKISVGLGEWHAVPLVHYATLARSLGRE